MNRQAKRAAERRAEEQAARPQPTVMDYFFDKKTVATPRGTATILEPRKDVVRRDELWGTMEWFFKRIERENRLHRRLLRWLTKGSPKRINPFAWSKAVHRSEGPAPVQEEGAAPRTGFDAEGRPIVNE